MPYGVDKDLGGDSKENVGWMEKCVNSVMDSGKSKSSAIAICKAQLKKKKEKDSSLEEEIVIDEAIVANFNNYREQWIRKSMAKGYTYYQAEALFNSYLSFNNYDIV